MLAGKLIRVTHFKDADITGNNVVKYKSNQDKTLKWNGREVSKCLCQADCV